MTPFVGQVQNLLVTSPPAEEPITLALAKSHLRQSSTFTDDDLLIGLLITAARERCEAETHRAFVTQGYLLSLNGFPISSAPGISQVLSADRLPNLCYGKIKIPKPPLIAVSAIQYIDEDGDTQTVDPSLYLVNAGGKLQGVVTPAYGLTWPVARYQLGSVTIAYTAGYGAPASVPAGIQQAMLLMLGHWYRNTEDASELDLKAIPRGSQYLLASFDWGSYG